MPDGSIVVAAGKDECSAAMNNVCKAWFADMGSAEIWNLEYRHSFAFIGTAGQKDGALEKRAKSRFKPAHIQQIFQKNAGGKYEQRDEAATEKDSEGKPVLEAEPSLADPGQAQKVRDEILAEAHAGTAGAEDKIKEEPAISGKIEIKREHGDGLSKPVEKLFDDDKKRKLEETEEADAARQKKWKEKMKRQWLERNAVTEDLKDV